MLLIRCRVVAVPLLAIIGFAGTAHAHGPPGNNGNPTILKAVKAVAAQLITLQKSVDSLIASSQPRRTPYQVVVRSTDVQPNPMLPPVPAGKRLVITTVSVRTFVDGEALGMMKLQLASGLEFHFPMTYAGTSGPPQGNSGSDTFKRPPMWIPAAAVSSFMKPHPPCKSRRRCPGIC